MGDDHLSDDPARRRRTRPLIGRLGGAASIPGTGPTEPGEPLPVTRPQPVASVPSPWAPTWSTTTEIDPRPAVPYQWGRTGQGQHGWDAPPVPPVAPLETSPPGPPRAWPAPPPTGKPAGPGPGRGRPALLAALVGALVGALVSGGLVTAFDTDDEPTTASARPALELAGEAMDIAGVLDEVQASVVSIEINDTGQQGLFGGAGSGVVISEDGMVLTNAHVVDGARSIDVVFFDGSRRDAELVGSLPADDIALIRVADTEGLDPARLGSSAELQVGDEVVAIGNALNLGGRPSVTRGIVSAKDRSISDATISLDELIQTDAAINPGNSGGPLVNAFGEVVGINTAIIQDAQNVGFAIAIDAVKPRIDDIREGRAEVTPDTALLGVGTNDLDQVAAPVLEEFGVDTDEGAFVVNVVPGSGAADAGIEPGDVIVGFDGEAVTSSNEVRERVRSRRPGDEVEIAILRDGEPRSVTAELGSVAD